MDKTMIKDDIWSKMKLNVLDSNYSRGEIDIFKHLANHTYGYYQSPRAWKALLNYHRLIRSLMTYNTKKYGETKAWKRQLIVWVFFCWQWKEQMNKIFKNWETLTRFRLANMVYYKILVDENKRFKLQKVLKTDAQLNLLSRKKYADLWDSIDYIYPTLSEIVKKQKKASFKESQNNASSSSSQQKQKKGERKKLEGEDLTWDRMSRALEAGKYDVTMQAIQTFQKFRFDCEPGHLQLVAIDEKEPDQEEEEDSEEEEEEDTQPEGHH
eukprot:c4150_g1_i1 orf=209-1012(-)